MRIYAVIDTASGNVLGEFESIDDAEGLTSSLLAADRKVGLDLELCIIEDDDLAPDPTYRSEVSAQARV